LQRQVAGLAGSTSPKLHGMHHPATATHLRSKSRCVTTPRRADLASQQLVPPVAHVQRAAGGGDRAQF
jgi:hypothetical protein